MEPGLGQVVPHLLDVVLDIRHSDVELFHGAHGSAEAEFLTQVVRDHEGQRLVEVGAGERLVNRALINLFYQADLIDP